MSYSFDSGIQSEGNVEVHKYYGGVVAVVALLAIVIQAFLHRYGRWAEFADLPLLVTIYFGVSRRNAVSGMLLGAAIGIAQDALSHDNPLGLYGIAKTVIGYIASSVGARIDTEHPFSRFALVFVLYHVHQFIFAGTERVLLNRPTPFLSLHLLLVSLVSAAIAVALFSLLDRLRRQS
ncbi:MAG: rod shape-determining protein MreD [Acidobacteriota bacterium]|nr:rod shape-determining protein MreD [Acidobacteriota bacterium]